MLSYCLKCKKSTESINPKLSATSNAKTMRLSKCAICDAIKIKIYQKTKSKRIIK